MIVDEIDRPVTHEQARVNLGEIREEIRDNWQSMQPAELQRATSRLHPCGRVFVLSMTRFDRKSSTAV
jgi:hypothetical protein